MKELYELKDLLCEELKEYGKKGELSTGSLDVVDKLAHALKSVETIIAMEEADGEYSGRNGGTMYGGGYHGGSSYAGRRGYTRRDSMGRYSRDGYSGDAEGMIDQLRDLMEDAPNEQIRSEVRKLMTKLEKM